MKNFLDKNSISLDIPDNIRSVKLDIGLSYNAPISQLLLENNENTIVFGFEPLNENISSIMNGAIKRNKCHGTPLDIKFIKNNRFRLVPCALSDAQGLKSFYVTSRDSGCSSLFEPKKELLGEVEKVVQVPVFTLEQFFDNFPWEKIPKIDFIKIDAQGSDLQIIKGIGKYLDRIVYITAEPECREYYSTEHNSLREIHKFLTEHGFQKILHSNTSDPTYLNLRFKSFAQKIFIAQI